MKIKITNSILNSNYYRIILFFDKIKMFAVEEIFANFQTDFIIIYGFNF